MTRQTYRRCVMACLVAEALGLGLIGVKAGVLLTHPFVAIGVVVSLAAPFVYTVVYSSYQGAYTRAWSTEMISKALLGTNRGVPNPRRGDSDVS